MNFIWDKITEWLKGLLVGGIVSNLSGLFDSINTRVSDVAATVGKTPQAWNGSIFNMIRNLSENVIVPIAGIILTFVMCLELIQLIIDRNCRRRAILSENSRAILSSAPNVCCRVAAGLK